MTERISDDERRALLAGDRAGRLDPDEVAEIDVLVDLLADPSTWAEPRPELEDTVLRAVAAAGPPVAPLAGGADRRARPRRSRGLVLAALGAAAAVALVVGMLAVVGGGTDPDYRARLTATGLAPRARAAAAVTRNAAGFRIELDAHGLRRLHHGAYYQAWLKNAHGGLVSIGTFSSSDGAIVLWSGVDPREYRGITVTLEPDDDNPASSGRRVLAGALRPV
jgi:hypothetical protein